MAIGECLYGLIVVSGTTGWFYWALAGVAGVVLLTTTLVRRGGGKNTGIQLCNGGDTDEQLVRQGAHIEGSSCFAGEQHAGVQQSPRLSSHRNESRSSVVSAARIAR